MTNLRYNSYPDYRSEEGFPDDVALLHGIMNGLGYDASPEDIASAYAAYSEEEWCAGWLCLPTGTEELQSLVRYLIEHEYLAEEQPAHFR